jgi:hypothetical protein
MITFHRALAAHMDNAKPSFAPRPTAAWRWIGGFIFALACLALFVFGWAALP